MAAAATLGHRFCIFLTVVAPAMIITKAAGPRAKQPPLLHSGVECVRTGAALKGVTATTQDGCENVLKKKNPSAGERGSVCSCMHTGV